MGAAISVLHRLMQAMIMGRRPGVHGRLPTIYYSRRPGPNTPAGREAIARAIAKRQRKALGYWLQQKRTQQGMVFSRGRVSVLVEQQREWYAFTNDKWSSLRAMGRLSMPRW